MPAGQPAVEALIEAYAGDLSAKQQAQLSSFSLCESTYTQFNENGSPYLSGYGTPDCGAFQLNKVHWDGKTPETSIVCISLNENVKAAIALYRKYGSSPWDNSKACWNKPKPGW